MNFLPFTRKMNTRLDLRWPLNYLSPSSKTLPWSEEAYNKANASMDPSWLPWGANRVKNQNRGVYQPVYPGQKPMEAMRPNYQGVTAFRQRDEASEAVDYGRAHWWGNIRGDTVCAGPNQFGDYESLSAQSVLNQ